jgi:serine/threonine protein kinase
MSYRSKKKDKKLLDLFQVCPSSLTIDDEDIVRGGYGFMVKGTYEKRPVVIEKIRKRAVVSPFAVEDWWVSFAKEAETLKSINHPHIITYFGVFYNPDMQEPILVRELMSMNLREYLVKNRHVLETLKQIHLCLQIALGLQFLHHMTPPLVHGNINDKNVLVDDNGLVKIGGLDQSKHIINKDYEQRDSDFYTQVSSRFHFMEPVTTSREVSDKAQYMKTAVDIFALGALGTQIAIRSHHFLGIHGFGLLPKLHIRDEALSLSEVHPLRPLFLKCLENTGEKRPHIEQIVDELVCLMAPDYMDSKVQGVVDKIKAENKALTLENMKLENERETLCKHLTSAELSESSLSTQLTEAQEMLKTMKEERNAYQEERKAQEARHAQLEEEMKLLSCDLNKTKNSLIKKIVRWLCIMFCLQLLWYFCHI